MHMPSLYIHILVCFYHQEGTPFLKYLLMHWKKWIFLVPKQIITKIHKNLYLPASFEAAYAMFVCIFFLNFKFLRVILTLISSRSLDVSFSVLANNLLGSSICLLKILRNNVQGVPILYGFARFSTI